MRYSVLLISMVPLGCSTPDPPAAGPDTVPHQQEVRPRTEAPRLPPSGVNPRRSNCEVHDPMAHRVRPRNKGDSIQIMRPPSSAVPMPNLCADVRPLAQIGPDTTRGGFRR